MKKLCGIRSLGVGACALSALLLAACAGGAGGSSGSATGGTVSATPGLASTAITLKGVVHGGQSPIVGATVSLYEAGPAATPPAAALQTVTTGSDGSYSFSNYSCSSPSSSALLYIVASGGNPGAGANTAINLMAAIGPCSSVPSYVVVNELTTVAAVYALNGFAYQSSGITGTPGSLNGCVDCTPTTPSDMTKLNGSALAVSSAFVTAANLVDVTTGDPAAWLPTAGQCGGSSPPANCEAVEKLAALANSLAACVNSASGSSDPCLELFDCATSGATFTSGSSGSEGAEGTCTPGATPATDTLAATLAVVRAPAQVAINGIYDVATQYAQFSPTLAAAPNDWTLGLNFTGAGLRKPSGIAIDGSGDVWVTNTGDNSVTELKSSVIAPSDSEPASDRFNGGGLNDPTGIAIDGSGNVWVTNAGAGANSVTELNSSGTALSGSGGITGGGLNVPEGIAIDGSGNVWVANSGGNSVTELYVSGIYVSGEFTGGGLNVPVGIAIDGSGNVWVTNAGAGANSVTELNSSGTALSGSGGITGGGLNVPEGITIDGSGDVWVANYNSSVTELSSSGTALSGSGGFTGGGLRVPFGIAIDGGGNVWVPNSSGNSVTELNSSGTALSGSEGFTGGGLNQSQAIAIDGSGDVWVANTGFGGVTELIGAAMPTVTPLVAQQR